MSDLYLIRFDKETICIIIVISILGLSAIHQAVLDNNLNVLKILLRHGADINLLDADSWTPLHAACANGHADIAK